MKDRLPVKKILAILLIVAGAVIIAYPCAQDYYYDLKQQRLMNSYLESMSIIRVVDDATDHGPDGIIGSPEAVPGDAEDNPDEELMELNKQWPVEAVLIIEKIGLFVPVIEGANERHLNISPASIKNTGKPWEKGGNYAIAGHRSRSYGRHFNRLNELETGDEIRIMDTMENEYLYAVFSKEIVHETDISILESSDKNELTLITCDPVNIKNPPTRLVVKASQI